MSLNGVQWFAAVVLDRFAGEVKPFFLAGAQQQLMKKKKEKKKQTPLQLLWEVAHRLASECDWVWVIEAFSSSCSTWHQILSLCPVYSLNAEPFISPRSLQVQLLHSPSAQTADCLSVDAIFIKSCFLSVKSMMCLRFSSIPAPCQPLSSPEHKKPGYLMWTASSRASRKCRCLYLYSFNRVRMRVVCVCRRRERRREQCHFSLIWLELRSVSVVVTGVAELSSGRNPRQTSAERMLKPEQTVL